MLNLSEVMMERQHQMEGFEDLVLAVHELARSKNERFFRIDIRPPFPDTPENWEDRLESAFY